MSSRTAELCLAGTQAEFERRINDARQLFGLAWEAATDDYEAAMAAHYVAHLTPDAAEALHWNLLALEHARRDERAQEFMGSLLVCLGHAHEQMGDLTEAERHYESAARHGVRHHRDDSAST